MANMGNPVFCDPLYGPETTQSTLKILKSGKPVSSIPKKKNKLLLIKMLQLLIEEESSGCVPVVGQVLHASSLSFSHPVTNQWVSFNSDLPIYFQKLIDLLRDFEKK